MKIKTEALGLSLCKRTEFREEGGDEPVVATLTPHLSGESRREETRPPCAQSSMPCLSHFDRHAQGGGAPSPNFFDWMRIVLAGMALAAAIWLYLCSICRVGEWIFGG